MPGPFDLIASNPPYLRDDEVADLRKLGWREPELALRGRPDGTALAERLIRVRARHALAPAGWLVLEAAPLQITKLFALMDQAGFHTIDVEKDLAGSNSVIAGRLPDAVPSALLAALMRSRATALAIGTAGAAEDPMPLRARPWMPASLRREPRSRSFSPISRRGFPPTPRRGRRSSPPPNGRAACTASRSARRGTPSSSTRSASPPSSWTSTWTRRG